MNSRTISIFLKIQYQLWFKLSSSRIRIFIIFALSVVAVMLLSEHNLLDFMRVLKSAIEIDREKVTEKLLIFFFLAEFVIVYLTENRRFIYKFNVLLYPTTVVDRFFIRLFILLVNPVQILLTISVFFFVVFINTSLFVLFLIAAFLVLCICISFILLDAMNFLHLGFLKADKRMAMVLLLVSATIFLIGSEFGFSENYLFLLRQIKAFFSFPMRAYAKILANQTTANGFSSGYLLLLLQLSISFGLSYAFFQRTEDRDFAKPVLSCNRIRTLSVFSNRKKIWSQKRILLSKQIVSVLSSPRPLFYTLAFALYYAIYFSGGVSFNYENPTVFIIVFTFPVLMSILEYSFPFVNDAAAIKAYFVYPVDIRNVILAKNLAMFFVSTILYLFACMALAVFKREPTVSPVSLFFYCLFLLMLLAPLANYFAITDPCKVNLHVVVGKITTMRTQILLMISVLLAQILGALLLSLFFYAWWASFLFFLLGVGFYFYSLGPIGSCFSEKREDYFNAID